MCAVILFNVHLFIVKLVKISFLFIICYCFYIPANKDYQITEICFAELSVRRSTGSILSHHFDQTGDRTPLADRLRIR